MPQSQYIDSAYPNIIPFCLYECYMSLMLGEHRGMYL